MKKRKDGRFVETITIAGKKKFFYGYTKAEAKKKAQSFKTLSSCHLFADVAEEWLIQHKDRVEPSTFKGYKPAARRAGKRFGEKEIDSVTPKDIDLLIRFLASQGYSRKVASTQICVINMIFNYAIVSGYCDNNPCTSVSIPSGMKKKKRELPSADDIRAVNESEWLFPFFLLYTGCRRGEALALRFEDIDRENKVIHITKAVGYDNGNPYIKDTKTSAGTRDIVLLDALAERLPSKKSGLVFPNKKGIIFRDTEFQYEWTKWRKKYNTNVSPHQLRHAYATILYEAGIKAKDAQYLMGHSSLAITMEIYTHFQQSRLDTARDKLNSFFK